MDGRAYPHLANAGKVDSYNITKSFFVLRESGGKEGLSWVSDWLPRTKPELPLMTSNINSLVDSSLCDELPVREEEFAVAMCY